MEIIPPGNPVKIFKKLVTDLPTPEKVAEESDNDIALLNGDSRWVALQAVIDAMINQLESLEVIDEKDTVEAIGMKFMVARLASSQLRIIRDLPENMANSNGSTE